VCKRVGKEQHRYKRSGYGKREREKTGEGFVREQSTGRNVSGRNQDYCNNNDLVFQVIKLQCVHAGILS